MVHSVPARACDAGCSAGGRRAHPSLRVAVLGYGGFRSGPGVAVAHRLLPSAYVALILDLGGAGGVVTGARDVATSDGLTRWGTGVSIGLSPVGAAGLLGVPMGELAGVTARLSDVLGGRAAELGERLAALPGWGSRFALLDEVLAGWMERRAAPDPVVTAAWGRLQRPVPPTVGVLAASSGWGRRRFERVFRDQVGLAPGAVRRVGRLQRAVRLLSSGGSLAGVAAQAGYAHQSHLSRDTRGMAGLTPAELRTFVRYEPLTAGR